MKINVYSRAIIPHNFPIRPPKLSVTSFRIIYAFIWIV